MYEVISKMNRKLIINLNMMKPICIAFFLVISNVHGQGLGSLIAPAPEVKEEVKAPQVIEPKIQPVDRPVSGSYDELLYLEKRCRGNSAQSCVEAGMIIMKDKPPQIIFDMSVSQRVKRALRLYEVAIVMGDLLAMELAYDLYYDENIINRQVNSYTDKERAMELREMMVSKSYSGGMLRLALDYLENPEFVTEITKKKEACRIIKANVDNKSLSITSKKIVDENKSSLTCRVL
jgi:hypothetical protein